MPETVTTPDNTNVAPTPTDVKATSANPSPGAVTQEPTKPAQDPKAAPAKAEPAKAEAAKPGEKSSEELKADADKAIADKTKADADKAKEKPGVPADGKYELKAPEGMTLDPELASEFSGIAKDLNLSQEDANKLIPMGQKLLAKQAEAQTNQWNETRKGWVDAQKSDKVLGGSNYAVSLEIGNRGLAAMLKAAPELKQAQEMGLLDHPGIWKAIIHHGKILNEARTIDGAPPNGTEQSAAERLYPNQGK